MGHTTGSRRRDIRRVGDDDDALAGEGVVLGELTLDVAAERGDAFDGRVA